MGHGRETEFNFFLDISTFWIWILTFKVDSAHDVQLFVPPKVDAQIRLQDFLGPAAWFPGHS